MESKSQLTLLGVSFRTAPVAVREALRYPADQAAGLLRQATATRPGLEILILSTCNRTEFYLVAPTGCHASGELLSLLRETRPDAPILHDECHRYQLSGQEAVRHLFTVACGLDSGILGDSQILGQVKAAMSIAADNGTLGGTLHRAVTLAVRAAKRARTETRFGWGSASLGSAIADIVAERDADQDAANQPPRVSIVGAGDMARDIGRHLAKQGGYQITFLNRTNSKAAQLAELCGGNSLDWHSLESSLQDADVVIAATACTSPVLSRATLDAVMKRRDDRRLLVLDAGVPRNVELGSAAEILNIDAIRERQDGALAQRRAAIPEVERIVSDELAVWEQWCALRPVEGMLKALFQNVSCVSRELSRELAAASGDSEFVEQTVHRHFCKLLGGHARSLRRLFEPPVAAPAQP